MLAALAYTAVGTLLPRAAAAVGDRVFPLTVVLTQAAPSDTLYVTPSTRPALGGVFLNLIPLSTKPLLSVSGSESKTATTVSRGETPRHWSADGTAQLGSRCRHIHSLTDISGRRV